MKNIVSQLAVIVFLSVILQGCGGTRSIVCPSGETVIVQKDPEKQYQQTVKKTNTSIKGTIDVLDEVNIADLDASVNAEIKELRDKLDQFSSRTQDIIKGSYNALQTTPCDKEVRRKHFELLENVNKESAALEKLKTEMDKLANNGNFGGVDENKIKSIVQQYSNNNVDELYDE